ncbi:hypothetical protein [Psychromicrobium lacuslunae]|nr:hypothetical protein [Psychromicrobium lacuslunae]
MEEISAQDLLADALESLLDALVFVVLAEVLVGAAGLEAELPERESVL